MQNISLYFHIPFCERKCLYCDFYSVESVSSMGLFVDALCGEIAMASDLRNEAEVGTIFFGGGTPSLLTPGQLERILGEVRRRWNVLPGAEITLETNPGTADGGKLKAYRSLGVNRLSIGIQSFDEEELRFLSRIHDSRQAVQCVQDAREAGFGNVSIDLIYSLPGQTMDRWIATLEKGVSLEPDHLSAYSLIVEENTPLVRMVRSGQVIPNPPEAEASMYERTMEVMATRGYGHYEVSNYALPGFRCRHNLVYWHRGEYIGFGPSAHSFVKNAGAETGVRYANVANVSAYLGAIAEGKSPLAFEESVGEKEAQQERIFLGLRGDGLDERTLEVLPGAAAGAHLRPVLDGLIGEGLAVHENGILRLTDRGYLLCDEIAGRLMP